MSESAKKSFVIFTYFVLILSTLLVFGQVCNFDFINYDDNDYVTENPHFSHGLNRDDVIWAFTTPNIGNWLPLTWLSFMLDSQLFGLNPGRMHLVNLLLHIANTLLLFALLKKITGSLWPSAFVAAAFALHPMHVESVAWVIERKDVLSTFFFMLTVAAYVGYVRSRGPFRYLLTILLFVFGLLAKPMLIMLPFVLLLLDYWPLNRFIAEHAETSEKKNKSNSVVSAVKSPVWLIVEKVPFFALAAVWSVITFLVQQGSGAVSSISALSLADRIANTFLSYARYIGKMFWPRNMSVFYPLDIGLIPLWQIVLSILLVLVITILALRFGRKQKYLPVGWFWFVGTLIPVIGLVQSGPQGYADRYTYIPYIGLFIAIAWGLPELLSKWPQRKIVLGLSMVIALTTLGICTHKQVSFWNNSITLFSHAIEVTQNNYLAYNNLGVAYNSLGRWQDEIDAYKQAIRIKPDNIALFNLGVAYGKLGRGKDEIESYKQAIKIKPDYTEAYINLGVACNNLGRYQDAIETYKQVIKIKPDYAEAYFNLGVSYGGLGLRKEEIESYKQAVKIKPDYAEAYYNLGVSYEDIGSYYDAIETFKQTVRIKPDYAEAHFHLGVACLATGDKGSAHEEYKILKTLNVEMANGLLKLISK